MDVCNKVYLNSDKTKFMMTSDTSHQKKKKIQQIFQLTLIMGDLVQLYFKYPISKVAVQEF